MSFVNFPDPALPGVSPDGENAPSPVEEQQRRSVSFLLNPLPEGPPSSSTAVIHPTSSILEATSSSVTASRPTPAVGAEAQSVHDKVERSPLSLYGFVSNNDEERLEGRSSLILPPPMLRASTMPPQSLLGASSTTPMSYSAFDYPTPSPTMASQGLFSSKTYSTTTLTVIDPLPLHVFMPKTSLTAPTQTSALPILSPILPSPGLLPASTSLHLHSPPLAPADFNAPALDPRPPPPPHAVPPPAPAPGPPGTTRTIGKASAKLSCPICARTFRETSARNKHVRSVHQKIRDYACQTCGQRFAEKSNLRKHVQARHRDERPHACKQCPKRFHFTDGLARHVRNCHLELRPYKCGACGFLFKQRTHLQKHARGKMCGGGAGR